MRRSCVIQGILALPSVGETPSVGEAWQEERKDSGGGRKDERGENKDKRVWGKLEKVERGAES